MAYLPSQFLNALLSKSKRRAVVLLVCAQCVWADEPRGSRRTDPVALSHYVPSSARVFITVNQLDAVDRALDKAHAWRLLSILSGTSSDSEEPFDLRGSVVSFLGPRSAIDIDDLMSAEMGLAAASWSDLADGMWLARLPSADTLDRWFPKDRRRSARLASTARFLRMDDGVIASVRDDIVALTRRVGLNPLLRETRSLMAGRRTDSLDVQPAFQELRAYLPSRPLAVAYFSRTPWSQPGEVDDRNHRRRGIDAVGELLSDVAAWIPGLHRGVVGMYARDGRVDFAIRAARKNPQPAGALSKDSLRRFGKLPHTTLLAWATTIDARVVGADDEAASEGQMLRRYLKILLGASAVGPAAAPPQIGPHVILVWGQDLTGIGSTAQLAVLIECEDAFALDSHFAGAVVTLARRLAASDPSKTWDAAPVQRETHLDATISSISLRSFVEDSSLPFARLLSGVELSWAAQGNWFILGLSRDHVERIVDGKFGLVGTLDRGRDMRATLQRRARPTSLAIVQGALVADVLDGWLAEAGRGVPSLLNLWSQSDSDQAPPASVLSEFASVGRAVPFASLSVLATDENHLSAMLSLRFAPTRKADPVKQ